MVSIDKVKEVKFLTAASLKDLQSEINEHLRQNYVLVSIDIRFISATVGRLRFEVKQNFSSSKISNRNLK